MGFGSSNTASRCRCQFNWLDWLDFGLAQTYGRVHHTINAGVGGDTTRGLLRRFDEDVALYRPHLVFITIGGNDANPENGISEGDFARNLRTLAERVHGLECACLIFQTYYSADIEKMDPQYGRNFLDFMDVIRRVAATSGGILVDHHGRWERLRKHCAVEYRQLMEDPLHVNPQGNMLMGLDLLRLFEATPPPPQRQYLAEGLKYQRLCDRLDEESSDAGN